MLNEIIFYGEDSILNLCLFFKLKFLFTSILNFAENTHDLIQFENFNDLFLASVCFTTGYSLFAHKIDYHTLYMQKD